MLVTRERIVWVTNVNDTKDSARETGLYVQEDKHAYDLVPHSPRKMGLHYIAGEICHNEYEEEQSQSAEARGGKKFHRWNFEV